MEEKAIPTDRENLERVKAEREELGAKMREAQAKREKSKDGLERIRLRAFVDDSQEKILALENQMQEIAGRIGETEKEEARARAGELHAEAQTILKQGWVEMKRCAGYLKTIWVGWRTIFNLRAEFRMKRDIYEKLCKRYGFIAEPLSYEDHTDITLYSGRNFPNVGDMLAKTGNFTTWLTDMSTHWRGLGGVGGVTPKDVWPR